MIKALNIFSIGFMVIIIGFVILFIGVLLATLQSKESSNNVKISFFGLVGSIPFGFSNDKGLFIFSIILTIILVILTLFLRGAAWH